MPHGGCMFRLRFRAAMIFEHAPSDRFRMMKKTQGCAHLPSRSPPVRTSRCLVRSGASKSLANATAASPTAFGKQARERVARLVVFKQRPCCDTRSLLRELDQTSERCVVPHTTVASFQKFMSFHTKSTSTMSELHDVWYMN